MCCLQGVRRDKVTSCGGGMWDRCRGEKGRRGRTFKNPVLSVTKKCIEQVLNVRPIKNLLSDKHFNSIYKDNSHLLFVPVPVNSRAAD